MNKLGTFKVNRVWCVGDQQNDSQKTCSNGNRAHNWTSLHFFKTPKSRKIGHHGQHQPEQWGCLEISPYILNFIDCVHERSSSPFGKAPVKRTITTKVRAPTIKASIVLTTTAV